MSLLNPIANLSCDALAVLIKAEQHSHLATTSLAETFKANDEAMQKAMQTASERISQLTKQLSDLQSHKNQLDVLQAARLKANNALIATQSETLSQLSKSKDELSAQVKNLTDSINNLNTANASLNALLDRKGKAIAAMSINTYVDWRLNENTNNR